MAIATFGAGCFWGVQSAFDTHKVKTTVGYSGGHTDDVNYEKICRSDTGHAEVVQVEYDPRIVTYDALLNTFWSCHDPTQKNRQGPDVGSQYRSVIFYHEPKQRILAIASKAKQQQLLTRPIVTEIIRAQEFHVAEKYHQKYNEKHGKVC